MSVRVRVVQAIKLCQRHGLNNCESLFRTVFQVTVSFLAVEPVEQFPRGVTQIEERGSVVIDEEPPVITHPQA
jgi:hypothetical protein